MKRLDFKITVSDAAGIIKEKRVSVKTTDELESELKTLHGKEVREVVADTILENISVF